MRKKYHKKLIFFILIFIIFLIPYTSAVTLENTLITSNGLNTTINVTAFSITFDQLDVLSNAITIHNLSYVHPSSCNGQSSSQSLFNYTTQNQFLTSSEAFSNIPCSGGHLPRPPLNITEPDSISNLLPKFISSEDVSSSIATLIIFSVFVVFVSIILFFQRIREGLNKFKSTIFRKKKPSDSSDSVDSQIFPKSL